MRLNYWLAVALYLTMSVLHPALAENIVYPADAGVIDLTKPPYNAKGDGVTDATDAIQNALRDWAGQRNTLYLPNGTYLIRDTLTVPLKNRQGNMLYGFTHIQGQSEAGTILKLSEGAFPDPKRPRAVLTSGGHGSADWFHCSIRNLSIDTGKSNAGATGLQFFSNNTGCVKDVTIRSGDGAGVVGLDLAYNDMNGPLLIKNVTVIGFDTGIACGYTVNSQTFEHIALRGQRLVGFRNDGQCVSIRDLRSRNAVAAIVNSGGLMTLVDSMLTGEHAGDQPALTTTADLYVRNLKTSGYKTAIAGAAEGRGNTPGPNVAEYVSRPALTLFPSPAHALDLPIRETPDVPEDNPATWDSPMRHGFVAKPGTEQDISEPLQKAIDSGATTVYLPCGGWHFGHTVHVRGKVRRLIGFHAYLAPSEPVNSQDAPFFQFDGGSAQTVVLERIDMGFGNKRVYGIQNNSHQTIVLRDMTCYAYRNGPGAGPLFIEDVVGGPFTFSRQTVWARQINQESEGTHVANDGGIVWLLGYKTERGGTLLATTHGGKSQVDGGLCYTTTAGKLAPMFTGDDSDVSVSLGERRYSGDPYITILRETRNGITKTLANTDPAYRGQIVLYAGHRPKR